MLNCIHHALSNRNRLGIEIKIQFLILPSGSSLYKKGFEPFFFHTRNQ